MERPTTLNRLAWVACAFLLAFTARAQLFTEGEALDFASLRACFDRTFENKDFDSCRYWNEKIRVYNHSDALAHFHINQARLGVKQRQFDSLGLHLSYIVKTYDKATDSTGHFFMGRQYEIAGFAHFYQKDLDAALVSLDKAVSEYYRAQSWENAQYTLNMMGTMAYVNSMPEKAAGYLFRSLEVFAKNPADSAAYADILVDLANAYNQLKREQKAVSYLEKALKVKNVPLKTRADILTNLATCKIQLGQPLVGIKLLDSARVIYESTNDEHNLAALYNNLGSTLIDLNPRDERGKYYLKRAIALAPHNGYSGIEVSALLNLSKIFLETGVMDSASFYLKRSSLLIKDINDLDAESSLALYWSQYYKNTGQYQLAYEYYVQHSVLKDSIINAERMEQLTEQENSYDNRQEENKIRLLQQEALIKDLNLSQTKLTNAIILMLVVLLTIGGGIFLAYQRNRFQKRITLMAAEQSSELSKAIIKGEEEERNRIARDLHDGVGNTLALVKTIVSDKGYKDVQDLINRAHDEVREVAHNLMPGVLLRFGLKDALKELSGQWQKTRQVSFDLSISIEETVLPVDQKVTLYRIIQELIKNAMTKGMADLIIVDIRQRNDKILVRVEDNGKGFDTDVASKGLGMQNIRNRVFYLNGTMDVESSEAGSAFFFAFPIQPNA
jgi:signal transduction histidine kinase